MKILVHRILFTIIIFSLMSVGIGMNLPREHSYPDLTHSSRLLQQGFDYLDVDINTPFDSDSAIERFNSAFSLADVTESELATIDFLRGWAEWVRPIPEFGLVRQLMMAHRSEYVNSPHRTTAAFIQGLAALHDPVSGNFHEAESCFLEVFSAADNSYLGGYAAMLLADLYLHKFEDMDRSADWYLKAYKTTDQTYTLEERLGFLYARGRLMQQAGQFDTAETTYRYILEEGQGGGWIFRVLDRLDELEVAYDHDFVEGLDPVPIPMTTHRYVSDTPIELRVSFWILEKAGMRRGIEEIVRRYEAKSENVRIRLVDLPYGGYHDWLQSQMLGREIPDIVMIDNGSAIRYGAYQGKLVDMTEHLEQVNPYTGMRWSEMYYPQFILNARDPVYRRNWIVSWASENTAYFYNKDAFRRAGILQRDETGNPLLDEHGKELVDEPKTWVELIQAFEALKSIGVYGEVSNFFPDPAPIIWQLPYYRKQVYDNLISQYDTYFPDDYPDPYEITQAMVHNRMDLSAPNLAEPWRLLYEKSEYWVPGATSMDLQQAFEAFASGRAATLFWVSTDMTSFEQMCDFELGVFPFPLLKESPFYDGEYAEEFSLSAFEFCVPANTRDKGALDATLDFLMYFTSPEAQAILSEDAVCMSPIRGVPVPDRLEPFLTRMNRRGTHMVWFDPYTIGITKEPYWIDARDKLWNELSRLLGSIPNYTYYERLTGGTQDEYELWREEQLQRFLIGLQDYFEYAYQRVIREYPEDLKRELKRTQNRWLGLFREIHAPLTPAEPAGLHQLEEELSKYWRSIIDNWGMISRFEGLLPEAERLTRYEHTGMSYREQKQLATVLRISLVLLIGLITLFLLWIGVLGRVIRDFKYIRVLIPTLMLMGIFSYTPALSAIYHAFFLWNGSDIAEYIGLDNFRAMLSDDVLHQSVRVMLVFLVANLIKFLPSVIVAVVLFHLANTHMQYTFRVIFVLPMAIPGMVGLLVWKYFYRMDGGVLNWILLQLNIIRAPVNWLGTEETVVPALLFLGFPWISTIGVLILLAGLQSIDKSVFEAARIDGCGLFRRFWAIEMPLIMGQIKLNIVLITIGTIQDFWLPLILTRGGPNNASMLPGLWMYQSAFSHGQMGYAAALGVAMFLVILLLTFFNLRFISADRTK